MTTCNHSFCRSCLFECFKRLSLVRCPICNSTLNRRSCASCPLLSSATQKYLLLAKAFKKDLLASDFGKENDFVESQVPMTQVPSASGSLLLHTKQQEANLNVKRQKEAPKTTKRRLSHPYRSEKLLRMEEGIAEDAAANCTTDISVRIPGNESASCQTTLCSKVVSLVSLACSSELKNLSFKEVQTNSLGTDDLKLVKGVGVQTDFKMSYNELQGCDANERNLSATYAGENVSNQNCCEKNIMDLSAQMELVVNIMLEEKKLSAIEVLLTCMPWITNFLSMSREDLISAVGGTKAKEEISDEPGSSKNDIDLVPESDDEIKLANQEANKTYAVDSSLLHDQKCDGENVHAASSTENKQLDEKNVEKQFFLLTSGMSKLSHQTLLRGFLDSFSSFMLSTSINRRCTHLVVFNADGLVCEYWSVKFIYALVNHCTIVSHIWMDECLKQGRVVPTDGFEVSLKIDGTLVNITAQRALIDPRTVFEGCVFYVPQTFFRTRLVARDVFVEILELSGGKVVSHVWELPSEQSYIIFAPDCINQDAARRFESDVKKEVLTADWVFASIGQHRILDKEPYRIVHPVD